MFDEPLAKLTKDEIVQMCQRGFGREVKVGAIQEMGGGTFNETYLVKLGGRNKAILRVAPQPRPDLFWDDVVLMRREHAMFPYFASLSPLIPKILLTDFTHQLIDRDYMFQSVLPGERWSEIEHELTPDENLSLWRQCGEIVQRMHATSGEWFGYPFPGFHAQWSDVVLERFSRISQSMEAHELKLPTFDAIFKFIRNQSHIFDEIVRPSLLHGNLWTFNFLVERGEDGPTITGVLDMERAWWGDPRADWIMFLLALRRENPQWEARIATFEAGYGDNEEISPAPSHALLRRQIYKAMHIGLAAIWGFRHKREEEMEQATLQLDEIAESLP
ncbi:MAG: phosphotransferase [Anaerolineales bacterium]|nr:phosphotransferase [Anaerolineales bacterium]